MSGDPELDPVIHAQARLRVTVTLAALEPGDQLSFPRLQHLLDMTAGNLSTHLRKLEDAGYVEVTKTHEGRTPVTYLALTTSGRLAFESYVATLRTLLDDPRATGASASAAGPSGAGRPDSRDQVGDDGRRTPWAARPRDLEEERA